MAYQNRQSTKKGSLWATRYTKCTADAKPIPLPHLMSMVKFTAPGITLLDPGHIVRDPTVQTRLVSAAKGPGTCCSADLSPPLQTVSICRMASAAPAIGSRLSGIGTVPACPCARVVDVSMLEPDMRTLAADIWYSTSGRALITQICRHAASSQLPQQPQALMLALVGC